MPPSRVLSLVIAASFAFALTACREDRLDSLEGQLAVTPERVVWQRVFVGHPARRTVVVENLSRAPMTVTAAISEEGGPFSVTPSLFELPAGTQVEVELRVVATAVGPAEGVLRFEADARVLDVPLRATAEAEPTCAESSPCHASRFDPLLGECVDEALPDGAACTASSACILEARCFDGQCVGTPVSCDDGNACTTDACADDGGCIHVTESADVVCGQPEDPCQAAFCDPQSGCGLIDVADGTACGAADCASASVCMAGACRELPVPEGAACGNESPCHAAGVCQGKTCVRPSPNTLTPVWSYQVPNTSILLFEGIADAAENLYWAECPESCGMPSCPQQPCVAVSATRDGTIRWRMPTGAIVGNGRDTVHRQMLVGDALVSFVGTGAVLAQRSSDGLVLWFRDLRVDHGDDLFGNTIPPAQRAFVPGSPGVDANGRILVPLTGQTGLQNAVQHRGQIVVALNALTGKTEWVTPVEGRFGKVASGLTGDAFVGTENAPDEPVGHRLYALTATGQIRWVSSAPSSEYPSVWNRVVVTGSANATDALSGATLWSHGGAPAVPGVLGNGSSYSIVWRPGVGAHDLVRRDLRTGAEQWTVHMPLVWSLSDLMLTDGGDVMLLRMTGDFAQSYEVARFSARGDEKWSCPLPPLAFHGGAALLDGRLVTKIVSGASGIAAYEVPGSKLASEGWVVYGGSPRRDGRPK